jgi:soluble lytic murein transglycosylase-like protein
VHARTARRVHATFAVAAPVKNIGAKPATIAEDRPERAPPAAANSKDAGGREAITLHDIARLRAIDDLATRHVALTASVSGFAAPDADTGHAVVEMIESMSPGYDVPTWFALRIAKIESNYNPRVRGRDGEYGIYQIKCETARMLGFDGDCAQLVDAQTNVEWGLKHLSEALKSSNGNLELAASKHNAGLGRQTLVRRYVNLVF